MPPRTAGGAAAAARKLLRSASGHRGGVDSPLRSAPFASRPHLVDAPERPFDSSAKSNLFFPSGVTSIDRADLSLNRAGMYSSNRGSRGTFAGPDGATSRLARISTRFFPALARNLYLPWAIVPASAGRV